MGNNESYHFSPHHSSYTTAEISPFSFLCGQVFLLENTLLSANVITSFKISRSFTNFLPSCLHGTHLLHSSQWKLLKFLLIHYPFLLPLSVQGPLIDYSPKSSGLRRASGSHSQLLLPQSRTEDLCLSFPLGLHTERGNTLPLSRAKCCNSWCHWYTKAEKALRLEDSAGAQRWHGALSVPTTCEVEVMMTFTITLPSSKNTCSSCKQGLNEAFTWDRRQPPFENMVSVPCSWTFAFTFSSDFEHFPWVWPDL